MSVFEARLRLERRPRAGAPFRLNVELGASGGITVVFGPSGSGKSSVLLALLGALRPARGRITIGDRVLFDADSGIDLPIWRRRVGIVFQDALLFPHLTAARNVGFAARRTSPPGSAHRWLERVGATELGGRMPSELSGGQRQRVALARALAAEPELLLLDEPFSALDARAREALGDVLRALQQESGVPFVHVTHDLHEAIRMGDSLVLLEEGRIVQAGAPAQVVAAPATAAAARAVGTENLFRGTVTRHHPDRGYSEVDLGGVPVVTLSLPEPAGAPVALGLRAEDVLVALRPLRDTSARNVLEGTVERLEPRASAVQLTVGTPVRFRVLVTAAALKELALAVGSRVHLLIKASSFRRLV